MSRAMILFCAIVTVTVAIRHTRVVRTCFIGLMVGQIDKRGYQLKVTVFKYDAGRLPKVAFGLRSISGCFIYSDLKLFTGLVTAAFIA